ncbi:unnamed protein product [Zymoseptoria tritici ST99CH_3D7]|uniref:Uncharacterized protein n=1 Tax=Zymoseptoria tritici (strain ST99CH_3D7) TaxID=1276538 RepID=A0A1X7S0B6_ZYMT9|nr:unnamed protein product [Zymoseptoria tritici ST99CH_3D7]
MLACSTRGSCHCRYHAAVSLARRFEQYCTVTDLAVVRASCARYAMLGKPRNHRGHESSPQAIATVAICLQLGISHTRHPGSSKQDIPGSSRTLPCFTHASRAALQHHPPAAYTSSHHPLRLSIFDIRNPRKSLEHHIKKSL